MNIIDKKINLFNFDVINMRKFFISIQEKSFRADQIMKWIYHHNCINLLDMNNIKKKLRYNLSKIVSIIPPKFVKEQISLDGSIKWSVLVDNQLVETIYIPEKSRATLCISTQAGCNLKCVFCLTGKQGFNRNLKVSEIIGQIWQARKIIKKNNYHPITNIVLMGMGEPLLNFNNVVKSIKIMLHPLGFGFSKKKITLSTSGIVPAINQLINEVDVNLAISLHAPNDMIRSQIMPINNKYNIQMVLLAAQNYMKKSKANRNGITIEYVLLHNINDSLQHANQLTNILSNIKSKINLIPWNDFHGSSLSCSSNIRIQSFHNFLLKKNFFSTIRKNRGQDIQAACGQLSGLIYTKK
ncbi:23S rRNA (adenine(2503)-C(2))-methyltransferase RlmN [Buchnera aphidicola]|uniref:23S rRNA (adenine(2503)-C(2))-methyltransferase RlmN n=1 Tax=Buchnera aphidicola TaxID=9 RepID=UPI0034647A51